MTDTITEAPEADEPQRDEWVLAQKVVDQGSRDLTDEDVAALSAEVLRLRDYAFQAHELVESATGRDVLDHMERRIRKLYMGLNAQVRWVEGLYLLRFFGVDAQHTQVIDFGSEPVDKWNRLISATTMAAALAVANGRWAVIEHREADRLRRMLRDANDAFDEATGDYPKELVEGEEWRKPLTFPQPPEGSVGARMEQLREDALMVITVYDEHVAPENRGPWRDRLHRWAAIVHRPLLAGVTTVTEPGTVPSSLQGPRHLRPVPEIGSVWRSRLRGQEKRVVRVVGYEGHGDELRVVLQSRRAAPSRSLVRDFHSRYDPSGGRCPQSDENVLTDRLAVCPGCGFMVEVRLVAQVWTFAPHGAINGRGWDDEAPRD